MINTGEKYASDKVYVEILEVTTRSKLVQFENQANPNLIILDAPQYMDHVVFEVEEDQP